MAQEANEAASTEKATTEVPSTGTSTNSKHKKVPLTLVVDNSNEKIDLTHYIAMSVWLGWPFFYLALMWTFPLLWWYAKPLLFTILAVLATSAFTSIDSRKQPKVSEYDHRHAFQHVLNISFYVLTVGDGYRCRDHEVSSTSFFSPHCQF